MNNLKRIVNVVWLVLFLLTSRVVGSSRSNTNVSHAGTRTERVRLKAPFVPGRILVQFRPEAARVRVAELISETGARETAEIPGIGVHIVELPAGVGEEAAVRAFNSKPEVDFAELDRVLPIQSIVPNDPSYGAEWHLPKIAAPTAWSSETGSSSITIAICDTGVDGTHPDLAPKLAPGWNFYDNNSNTSDVYGHGTAVAGVAAAASNNGVGVASVAWDCSLMPLRVSAPDGSASFSAISSAIVWAADQGARIANVSYIVSDSATVSSAAQYLQSKRGVLVVSAGNYATFDSSKDNPYMLVVSATDQNDVLATWSNTGNNIDLSAPGVSIGTTTNGGTYGAGSGTSFSAPIVAGVAALVLSTNPSLTPAQVTDILEQSADDRGQAGWDPGYGWGRVNAAQAVSLAGGGAPPPLDTTPPSVSIASPAAGGTISGTVPVQVTASDNVGVASVILKLDGTSLGSDTSSPYTFSWNTSTVPNGTHTLTATAADAAGNTASNSISATVSNTTADATPPTVGVSSPAAGATVSGTTSVQVSASDNVGVTSVGLSVDGVSIGIDTTAPYTFSWNTTSVPNGIHTVTAAASDAAGNTASSSISVTVNNTVLDTTPPTVAISAPTSGATLAGAVSVQVSAGDNVGVTSVSLKLDGSTLGTIAAAPYAFSWNTTTAANGAHTLAATAADAAGNTATTSISVVVSNITADTTPPTISITSPASGSVISGVLSVYVNAADNVGVVMVELYADGVLRATSSSAPFTTKWNTKRVASGPHTLQCKAYDAAGNVGTSPALTIYK